VRIVDAGSFSLGLVLLAAFAAVLALGLWPFFECGKTAMHKVDEVFNGLAKGSAKSSNNTGAKAQPFVGKAFSVEIEVRKAPEKAALVLSKAGCDVRRTDGKLAVRGDLGKMAMVVRTDADAMYENRGQPVRDRYGLPEREALYHWWNVLERMAKRFKAQGQLDEADLAMTLMTQCVEPAYNFYGVKGDQACNCPAIVGALLVLYVAYTLWYGLGIYLVFKGLGLRAGRSAPRPEQLSALE